jgi:hypothetical protein
MRETTGKLWMRSPGSTRVMMTGGSIMFLLSARVKNMCIPCGAPEPDPAFAYFHPRQTATPYIVSGSTQYGNNGIRPDPHR